MEVVCLITAICILLYSGVSTYVGLYGSGLFNFGSYVSLPTLFTCFLGFDVPTSSFIFIENVFYYSCNYTTASSGTRGKNLFALHLLYFYFVNIHTSLVLF